MYEYIGILLGVHYIPHISRIRVNGTFWTAGLRGLVFEVG